MRLFLPFLAIAAILTPVNVTLGYVGGKPLDLVPSDMLLLLFPGIFFYLGKSAGSAPFRKFTIALLAYLLFCVFDILVTQADSAGAMLSLVSFARYARPFPLFYVGFLMLYWGHGKAERWAAYLAGSLGLFLLASDILFNRAFPSPRWGGYFATMRVYGFPNSPGYFYVVCLALVLYGLLYLKTHKPFFWAAAAALGMTIILTGSRNAIASIVALFMLLFAFKLLRARYSILLGVAVAAGCALVVFSGINMGLLQSKLERTASEGVLYGRSDVWDAVLDVALKNPVLGYGFEPLTDNYSQHGTAHNQYIEYLYKTGFLGLCVAFWLWFTVGNIFYRMSKVEGVGTVPGFYKLVFLAFLVCLLSNFAQPNLSYTVTQAFFLFFAGMACARLIESEALARRRLRTARVESLA